MFENLVFPKVPGTFSFLCQPPNFDPGGNWLHRYMGFPQTFTNWLSIWKGFAEPIFPKSSSFSFQFKGPVYVPGEIPDPFFHRKEAGSIFEAHFFESQRIRARIRVLVRHRRKRIMDRRLIGEVDVATLERIPEHHTVRVYDWNSKAVYQFHTHTIHKQIVAALRFQSFGISMPRVPKNPYTNLPWSLPQLLVLIDQIHHNLWQARQRHMDSVVQSFRMCQLNIEIFQARVGPQLDVECARAFFREAQGEEWAVVYGETMEDFETILAVSLTPLIRRKLLDRTLPASLLHQWDELLLGIWGYQNLNRIIITGGSIFEIITNGRALIERTYAYLETLRKKAKPQERDGRT